MPVPAIAALMKPLAVSESWLNAAIKIAKDTTPEALLAYEGKQLDKTLTVQVRGGVAVVDVSGPLFKDSSVWSWFFGGSSYVTLRKDLETALVDQSVKSIVLNVDSPGGEVFGCNELADAIYEARSVKKIVAYAGGQCDSGAYWIASQCDEIVANATAELGSIGVRTMLIDDSERDKAQGIKEYNIVASQSPLKVVDPASASDRDRVQREMSAFGQVFVQSVARGRGVSSSRVLEKFGQGDVFVGDAAVKAGLADRIGSLESVIAELSKAPESTRGAQAKRKEGKKMANANTPTGTPQATMKDASCSGCDRDMDDDDDMYCAACYKADADASAMNALLGVADSKSAIGAIVALKEKAESADALKVELTALKASAQKTEIAALIDTAVRDGRIKGPAKKASMEKLAADFGVGALIACLENLQPSSAPAIPASDEATRKAADAHAVQAAGAESTFGVSAEQLKIAKKLGLTAEQFAKAKTEYRAIVQPVDEENN